MTEWEILYLDLQALVIFRNLLQDNLIQKLCDVLTCKGREVADQVAAYATFASTLLAEGNDLGDCILRRTFYDENTYVRMRARQEAINANVEACVQNELKVLEKASQLRAKDVQALLSYGGFLPVWDNDSIDFIAAYQNRMDTIATCGYGIYAMYRMFRVVGGSIIPVQYPDPIALANLKGYERERRAVLNNTMALIKGKPAANVLLYGDAGTGKSSTVKAIVNEYAQQGLRLVQITQDQFNYIPNIVEQLTDNPLKFILFIDDLSFSEHNEEFTALKAILEGSVSYKAQNISIYATSNRMHMVKELFSDREGDDIHRNDSIQELCSLSERFGLTVSFYKPGRELYLKIVHELRDQYGINKNNLELDLEAEQFALERGGRSPRVARQFIEHLQTMEK